MPTAQVDPEIEARLSALGMAPETSVSVGDVSEVVTNILKSLKGDLTFKDIKLYEELEDLAAFIEDAKTDIAMLRPDEVKDEFLPKAADELDAVVEATAEATNSIMDAVETVENVMMELEGENNEKLMNATTQIYEACGFQDITGQRITKVVGALKHIEDKVDALLSAFGDEIARYKASLPDEPEAAPEPEEAAPTDEELLHGPQKKNDAISQDEIDALLASFD